MKKAEFININYLKSHAEEIINNTEAVFPYWQWLATRNPIKDDDFLKDIWKRIEKKQLHESGNWSIFGCGDRWIYPGETDEEAENRIVREYCEVTGHWDLFIWEEVEE